MQIIETSLAGPFSYLVCGGVFAVLSAWLIFSGGKDLRFRFLVAAVASVALWCFFLGWRLFDGSLTPPQLFVADIVRDAVLLNLLLMFFSRDFAGKPLRLYWIGLNLAWLIATLVGVGLSSIVENAEAASGNSRFLIFSPLIFGVVGLALVESLYRGANRDQKWALKYFCLALGGIFAFDILFYAEAAIYARVNTDILAARGAVLMIAAPMIALTAKRDPAWQSEIFVSRGAVFYSGTFFIAGLYFTFVAAGGYYIRAFGGTWGAFTALLFTFCALVGLLALVLSERVRSRFKVFLVKNFYRNKYDYRDEWLRLIATLDPADADAHLNVRAITALAQIIGSENGRLWLQSDDSFEAVEAWNADLPEVMHYSIDESLRSAFEDKAWIVESEGVQHLNDEVSPVVIPDWLRISGGDTILVPLVHGNQLIGIAALSRPSGEFELTFEDIDLLRTAGRQIASYLAQEAATLKLAESRQFETYSKFSSFLVHDIKNLTAQLGLLVSNAKRFKEDPAFLEDALATIDNSVRRMKNVLRQFNAGTSGEVRTSINMEELLREVTRVTSDRKPRPLFKSAAGGEDVLVNADYDQLFALVINLVRNAQDATDESGKIEIAMSVTAGNVKTEITDTGKGMSESFLRKRLFKPFDSTKGSLGMGIGAYQVREYVLAMGGEINVQSTIRQGTRFVIDLPRLVLFEQRIQEVGQ